MFRSDKSLRFWCLTALIAILLLAVFQVGLTMAQDSGEAAPAKQESLLGWVARSSGLIGAVILLLSFYFVATVVRLFLGLRQSVAAPEELIEQFEALFQQRNFRDLYQVLRKDGSFLAAILAAAMPKLSNGIQEARNTLDRASDAATITLEKSCSMLAVLGTLGPMIGLLGTLQGMISSFSVIAMSDTQVKASAVAGGISQALILTFEGVLLSVPSIYFYALFRNRVATISANTTLMADNLLGRMADVWRKKQDPVSPSAAQPREREGL
jgi:biopolymer transport protein ExbB